MNRNNELFSSIDTSIYSEVKLGNDYKVSVNGNGVITMYTKNSERRKINDVYYVPSLKCNFMSAR